MERTATYQVNIRVTAEEIALLDTYAKKLGTTTGRAVKQAALEAARKVKGGEGK